MLFVAFKLEQIAIVIGGLLILFIIFGVINKNKKKNFVSKIVYKLMKNKMKDVKYRKGKKYDISFIYSSNKFLVKIYQGGRKKGFVMTNSYTIHEQKFKNERSSSIKSKRLDKLSPFLSLKDKGIKILLVKDNLMRLTKYINENELETIKYDVPAFDTYIVLERDFNDFIKFLKKKIK